MSKINDFLRSLYGRVSLVILLIISVLGVLFIVNYKKIEEHNQLAVMQGVNRSTAMYVAAQDPLITSAGVQEAQVSTLVERAMVVNPSLEIYVLNNQAEIISHRMPQESILSKRVELSAINAFLSGEETPVLGVDPRRPEARAVFSVAPIMYEGIQYGYVYVVIGGEIYQQLRQDANQTLFETLFLWISLFALLMTGIVAVILIYFITRPVRSLSKTMQAYVPGEPLPEMNMSGASNEITVLRRSFYGMHNTIDQQLQAIHQLDQTRRELIANVSHDLRTPLAAMQGALELVLLKKQQMSAEDRDDYLLSAFKQSHRLTRLVTDLFELAKLESGAIAPKLEQFSVSELLQDCSHDLANLAHKRQIELRLAIQDNVNPIVNADIGLIQRVLENLISNAIGHTEAGGVITLSIEQSECGAKVAVADTGKGIASAELPHIFERFYQAKNTEHSSSIGSGLGLAIVKRILTIHNASINVTSKINQGTCFEFELAAA